MADDFRNRLYYGDCYSVLQKHIASESVDLVYLDPPFNSNRDYNVLFQEQTGAPAEAQIKAFGDTWRWTADLYAEWDMFVDTCPNQPLVSIMQSFIQYLKRNDVTAYLARMTPRLYELHRVLKADGSLYLHCDPAASHYLKIVLDLIFDPMSYRNEIIWKRHNARSTTAQWPRIHDSLLFYSKGRTFKFKAVRVPGSTDKIPHTLITGPDGQKYQTYELTAPGRTQEGDSGKPWRGFDPSAMGRHWANVHATMDAWDNQGLIHWPKPGRAGGFPRRRDEMPFDPDSREVVVGSVWTDIDRINQAAKERLGYPTQKPLALLRRILAASSDPGDLILDPFCGCGTTVMAAQELGRKWIGIDITATATSLIEARLFDTSGIHNGPKGDYDIIGLPTTEAEAIELASRDKHEFQKWAISLVPRAMPWQEKKGADGGVDGFVRFKFGTNVPGTELVIISVKGGQTLKMDDVKNLEATMKANKAALGFLISLVPPTKGIVDWAQKAGFVKSPEGGPPVPMIQCRTVAQLLRGEAFAFPWNSSIAGIPRAGEAQRAIDIEATGYELPD